jgi:hypothetical protein
VRGGPACGTVPEHLSPLAAAADLCVRALDGQLERLEAETLPDQTAVEGTRGKLVDTDFALGSAHLDLALHPEVSDAKAEDHFDQAEIHFNNADDERECPRLVKRLAPRLNATYLGMFEDLRAGIEPTTADFNALGDSLKKVLHEVMLQEILSPDTNEHQRHKAIHAGRKIAILLLGCMNNTLMFPANARESSRVAAEQVTAHDAYTFVGGIKVPLYLLSNSSKRSLYSPHLSAFSYRQLLAYGFEEFADQVGSVPSEDRDAVHFNWLIQHFDGKKVPGGGTGVLLSMANHIKARAMHRASKIKQMQAQP